MKILHLEKAALAVTAAFLLLTAGYFAGVHSAAVPYRVDTQFAAENTRASPAPKTQDSAPPEASPAGDGTSGQAAADSVGAELAVTASPPPSVSAAARVNLNTADAAELAALPGIGEKKAAAIVADRAANGPFRIPEDLTRVKGIGEKTLAGLKDFVTVS